MTASDKVHVVSGILPKNIEFDSEGKPILEDYQRCSDALDQFNHPRQRRALILSTLQSELGDRVCFEVPPLPAKDLTQYKAICSTELIDFLSNAWAKWCALEDRREPYAQLAHDNSLGVPALIPTNIPLPRDKTDQRPSENVMGAIGYYCTDNCTPVFSGLNAELVWDAAIIQRSLALLEQEPRSTIYALQIHPGHHAAADSFGGYCYLNHAAFLASQLKEDSTKKVAILDVDYHCGNGTASIFDDEASVLVVSLHCHPDFEYPFHSGFKDQVGKAGTTFHLPLLPGTTWNEYENSLRQGLERIVDFGATALIVSLGLDTQKGDPVTLRRAGFTLKGEDYYKMGQAIGSRSKGIPTIFVQEGGYHMETVGKNVANVLNGFTIARNH